MELNSLLVNNAGISSCNDSYKVENIATSGKVRVWSTVSKSNKIWFKTDRWVISNYAGDVVYYSLLFSDPVSSHTTGDFDDPCDNRGSWVIAEGNVGVEPLPILTKFQDPNIIVSTTEHEPTIDPTTGDEIKITVTTYTDTISGNSFSDSQVLRTRIKYETVVNQIEKPVTSNGLTIGKVYKFTFVSNFAQLGNQGDGDLDNGFYKVDKICSYLDLVKGGIDIYANLYQPLNLNKEIFVADEEHFNDVIFYKLTDVYNPNRIIYMPSIFIEGTPSSSVDAYGKYLLSIDLGLHQELDMLTDLEDDIKLLLEAKYGIKRAVYQTNNDVPIDMTNPSTYTYGPDIVKFVKYDTVYLEIDDYNTIEKARKAKGGYYTVGTGAGIAEVLATDIGATILVNDQPVLLTTSNINDYKTDGTNIKTYPFITKRIDTRHIGRTIMIDNRPIVLTSANINNYIGTIQTFVSFIRPVIDTDGVALVYKKLMDKLFTVESNKMYLENKKLKTQVSAYEEIITGRNQ